MRRSSTFSGTVSCALHYTATTLLTLHNGCTRSARLHSLMLRRIVQVASRALRNLSSPHRGRGGHGRGGESIYCKVLTSSTCRRGGHIYTGRDRELDSLAPGLPLCKASPNSGGPRTCDRPGGPHRVSLSPGASTSQPIISCSQRLARAREGRRPKCADDRIQVSCSASASMSDPSRRHYWPILRPKAHLCQQARPELTWARPLWVRFGPRAATLTTRTGAKVNKIAQETSSPAGRPPPRNKTRRRD